MKLFSTDGRHSAASKLTKFITTPSSLLVEGDAWKIAFIIAFTVLTSWWMLSGIPEDEPIAEEPEVMVASVPVEEVVEVVTIDQTEALAMGIDAVISSECKSEWVSDATMIMVGNVIVNRTMNSRYPDTIDQVLCQPYQFSCFSDSGLKWVGKAADDASFRDRCMKAAEAVMGGERMLNYGVVYVSSGQQGTVEAQLDGLYFCS